MHASSSSARAKKRDVASAHRFAPLAGAAAALLALMTSASEARAQSSATTNTAKGMTAGGLLGAEIVLVTEAALGVKPAWAYWIGGVAGAGAGALGGYYFADAGGTTGTSFVLAGSVALIIPSMIAVVVATSFRPPEDYRVDVPAEGEPLLDDPDAPDEPLSADDAALPHLSLPMLGVGHAFSAEERSVFGVAQALEVRVQLLRGTF